MNIDKHRMLTFKMCASSRSMIRSYSHFSMSLLHRLSRSSPDGATSCTCCRGCSLKFQDSELSMSRVADGNSRRISRNFGSSITIACELSRTSILTNWVVVVAAVATLVPYWPHVASSNNSRNRDVWWSRDSGEDGRSVEIHVLKVILAILS